MQQDSITHMSHFKLHAPDEYLCSWNATAPHTPNGLLCTTQMQVPATTSCGRV